MSARQENYPPMSRVGLWDCKFKLFMGSNILIIAVVLGYLSVLHQKETDVITPLDAPLMVTKSGLDIPERYWGSYRSNLYFGKNFESESELQSNAKICQVRISLLLSCLGEYE